MAKKQKSGGGAKIGRDRIACARYRAMGTRERNKARRMARTSRAQPNNAALAARIKALRRAGFERHFQAA